MGVLRSCRVGRRRAVGVRGGMAEPEGDRDPEVVAVVAAVVFVVGVIVVAPAGLVLLGPGLPREAKRDQHGRCNQTLANAHCCSPSSGCAAQPDRATTATHRLLSQVRCQASQRSEEHTSELQSLMRISYAVFCLKKQTYNHNKKQ